MACEILACCQFFKDKMKGMPKSTEYIKKTLCHGEYQSCARFRTFKNLGGDNVPYDPHPDDTAEEVKNVLECIKNKKTAAIKANG